MIFWPDMGIKGTKMPVVYKNQAFLQHTLYPAPRMGPLLLWQSKSLLWQAAVDLH